MTRLGLVIAVLMMNVLPASAQNEPSGPHPRLWLDDATVAEMKRLAEVPDSAVARAITSCDRWAERNERNEYMGLNWAAQATNCAVGYIATGKSRYAKISIRYFKGLLDDWENLGDGKGGDDAVRHDSGYAMRAFAPHSAIVYDWLHDAPGMTEELRARARARFAAWAAWYPGNGYRSASPGTNYHAGYLFAVTLIAVAQGNEAGAAGKRLWRHVVDKVWRSEMVPAARAGGLLVGGDWGEGWQYGALSVAEYALAARALIAHGVELPEFSAWADSLLLRHVHGLTPSGGVRVGGDTELLEPFLPPNALVLAAVIGGPSSEQTAAWARDELKRLKLQGDEKFMLVFEAIAASRRGDAKPYPADAPTSYLVPGTGTLYARSAWSSSAVWLATPCVSTLDIDHTPANAGSFELVRGADALIVDPSPYGSLSSLTSNAPTVESALLPDDYKPSQAFWSKTTGYRWARQSASGMVVARCDYADQYTLQEKPSDVPEAMRDLVLIPRGNDATLVVIDRATSGVAKRGLHLRFRSLAALALTGDVAQGKHGSSAIAIRRLHTSGGKAEVRKLSAGDCWGDDTTRGSCDAARFPVQEYRVLVPGPKMFAVHVLDVGASSMVAPETAYVDAGDYRSISVERPGAQPVLIVDAKGKGILNYRGPANARHIVLGAACDRCQVSSVPDAEGCAVTLKPTTDGGKGVDGKPIMLEVAQDCSTREDPTMTTAPPLPANDNGGGRLDGVRPGGSTGSASGSGAPLDGGRPRGGGCCGVGGESHSSAVLVVVVALGWRRRRR